MQDDLRIAVTRAVSYRAREADVSLAELDDFLERAIAELMQDDATGPPFAIFHGQVNDTTRSRVEVGVPTPDGDRLLEGGHVVHARAVGETSYDPIHRVYDAIKAYIVANGLKQRGPTREVYHGRDHFSDEIEVVWPIEAP